MKKALFVFLLFYLSCDFITDLELPGVIIVSPSDGDTLVSLGQLEIRVEIQASDNSSVDHVELFLDNNLVATLTESPYTTNITDTASESHSVVLKAKAFDKGGNWKESDEIDVYIVAFQPYGFDEVGNCDTPGDAVALQIMDNYAYVADYDGGLRIIDLSNLSTPSEIGYYNDGYRTVDVAVFGDFAYLAHTSYSRGLSILDISDPNNPTLIGYLESPWDVSYGIAIEDTLIYQNFRDWGFCVVNVSIPSNPQEIGRLSISGDQGRLIKEGDYVYTVCEVGNKIINISDPTNPTEVGEFGNPFHYSHFINVAKSGRYIYTFEGVDMWIYDVSNPQNPVQVNEYFLGYGNSGYGIAIVDTLAYVSYFNSPYDNGGLLAINISNPSSPYIVAFGEFDTPGYSVVAVGYYIYVACGSGGLRIYRVNQ